MPPPQLPRKLSTRAGFVHGGMIVVEDHVVLRLAVIAVAAPEDLEEEREVASVEDPAKVAQVASVLSLTTRRSTYVA